MSVFRLGLHRFVLICSLLFVTVGCDQATKLIARDALDDTGPLTYFRGLVRLELAENPGAFLSLGAGLSDATRFWIFSMAVGIFLAYALWTVFRRSDLDKWSTIGLTLMAAGGVGNLIDRLAKGSVTDFLNFGIGSLRTGIFNIADVAIVVGVSILILTTLQDPKGAAAKPVNE